MSRYLCFLVAAACFASLPSLASATDLTGHWYQEGSHFGGGTQFDIVQDGAVVTIPTSIFFGVSGTETFEATLVGTTLTTSAGWKLRAEVVAGEKTIDGNVSILTPHIPTDRLLATRCECFDGNSTEGDGCDARCRVEPCFQCEGEPSICAPFGDGAECNDHQDCTAGETCSSGDCNGGSAVPACIDLTGRWKVETSGGSDAYLIDDFRDVEQRDGELRFRRPTYPDSVAEFGTVDQLTGALELSGGLMAGAVPYFFDSHNMAIRGCNVSFTGTVSADRQSFSGAGIGGVGTVAYIGTSAVEYGGCSGADTAFAQTAAAAPSANASSRPKNVLRA
jgi:cysteine-rich repeat protein